MIVAALQMQPVPTDVEANLAQIAAAARSAATFGATVLVTPEMAVTGYAIWGDIARLAEPRDGPMARRLSALARDTEIGIVAGLPERDGSAIYNIVVLAAPDGAMRYYRKCHLFGPREKAAFTPGTALSPVFEMGTMRAGLCICYDIEFPEMARSLALAGAELLLVATALPRSVSNDRVSRSLIPARALENHVFVAYAGLCGEENGEAFQGGSVIVGPDGQELARAGLGPTLLIAELEHGIRSGGEPDPYLSDRRPELYRL